MTDAASRTVTANLASPSASMAATTVPADPVIWARSSRVQRPRLRETT
jgi:hypothetical protein